MISVSKKGNYGFFCCVLHHAEKTPVVDSWCTFLSGSTYDMKAGILNIHC